MNRKIEEVIYGQHRPFSYEDFNKFVVDDKQYSMPYGTFRNKISERMAKGSVNVAYKVGKRTHYTLLGEWFEKPKRITDYHMVGPTCHPIFRELKNIRMGPPALHNIRLRFQTAGIWNKFCELGYQPTPFNFDIKTSLKYSDSLSITIGVHRSDTVSVSLGCTETPIAADIYGVIKLSNTLNVTREHISHIGGECSCKEEGKKIRIPLCNDWIVTLWHFGADSISKYTGEKFECTWQTAEGILVRIYTKEFGNGTSHVRFDKQENPKKKFADLISKMLFPSGDLV